MFNKPEIIIGALLFAAPTVLAQDTPPPAIQQDTVDSNWDLSALLTFALSHNPQLIAARESSEAARLSATALKALPNPRLQVTPGFSGSTSARDEEIILSQPLDVFGQRRAQRNVLEAQSRAAAASQDWTQIQILTRIKAAAADLFYTQEKTKLFTAQAEIAREFQRAAQRRAELGDLPAVQVQRAELEVVRAENDLTNAEGERLAAQATLNALLGRRPQEALSLTTDFLESNAFAPIADTTDTKSLISSRSDVLLAEAQVQAAGAQVQVLRRNRLPQFELQGRRDRVVQGGGSTSFRASLSLPIFDFGSTRGAIRAAEAEQRAQVAQAQAARLQAESQLRTARIRWETSRTRAARYRTQILPVTLDLLRKTQIGFEQGASSYLEVLESQRTSRQIQAEYLAVLNSVAVESANLEAAAGLPLLP